MNRQRKIVITVTYNDLGVIVDTKAEELDSSVQPNLQPTCNQLATDCISRQDALEAVRTMQTYKLHEDDDMILVDKADVQTELMMMPSVQPETAKRIVGKSRDGMTLWYQCDMCNEPVDAQDNYCRDCGRRLIDG